CPRQNSRLLGGVALGNPHTAKADALGLLRFIEAPLGVAHPPGKDVGTELVEQLLGAWEFAGHLMDSRWPKNHDTTVAGGSPISKDRGRPVPDGLRQSGYDLPRQTHNDNCLRGRPHESPPRRQSRPPR